MPGPSHNPWYRPLIRELQAGRMSTSEAAQIAGVSRQRIEQWCHAAAIDATRARKHHLAVFYAREFLRMGKQYRTAIAPSLKAKVPRRKPRKRIDKTVARAELDGKVIDFAKAGGKIKRIPKGKRTLRPL